MKIAFVGKGGAGKSTMSALFIRYLQQQNRPVLAIDADLNMNLAGLLGVCVPPETVLASPDVAASIRTHLKGENKRIADISKFLPTTPPGRGSNLIRRIDEPALAPYSVAAGPDTQLLTVGTYDADGIGQTCYHSHLFVAENILSHTITEQAGRDDFDVVCDMVAGTDAFAYSMYLQFDAIILVAEPTPESTEVCALYSHLAQEAGIADLVHITGNKIEDDEDLDYIRQRTGQEPLGVMPVMKVLKKMRQSGGTVSDEMLAPLAGLMGRIDEAARKPALSAARRMEMLRALHEKLNQKQWVQQGYGDVMGQIDPDFNFSEKAA